MKPLTKEEQDYLQSLYFDPFNPGSYESPERLYQSVRDDGEFSISKEQIDKWLREDVESYYLNRKVQRHFQRGRVMVSGIDDQWEADLADFQKYSKENEDFKYLLFVIDVFSRFLWVEPLKDKTSNEIVSAFDSILFETHRHPKRLRTDAATDFTSSGFQKLMRMENINHFVTHSEKQANYVERVIQTMKKKIFRYMVAQNKEKYINVLEDMVNAYNNTWHSGIQERPADVTAAKQNKLWWQMYWPNKPYKPKRGPKKKVHFKFKLGTVVRMSILRSPFQREYNTRWTTELFKISDRFVRQNQPIYKLVDWNNDPVQGTFYERELQASKEPFIYKIEKVLKYKGRGKARKALVAWKGWPKKFNSWIPSTDILEDNPKSEKYVSDTPMD